MEKRTKISKAHLACVENYTALRAEMTRRRAPITHPIPRLSPMRPRQGESASERIDRFVNQRMRLISAISVSLAALAVCTGCSVLRYTGPGGEHFSRHSFGTASSINALEVETGTNGVRSIRLRGYRNDSSDAIGVVTEAAVRAALSRGALPAQ